MLRFTSSLGFVLFTSSFFVAGCGSAGTPPTPHRQDARVFTTIAASTSSSASAQPSLRGVTLLYTTDEHGWLEGLSRDGSMRGGVAAFSGQLVRTEDHCPGSVPFGVPSDETFFSPQSETCMNRKTLLLSGGDNFTGPAISTYFSGEPMAIAMGRLGYAASAFGNHEFDFGRAQFPKNREKSSVRYLSANLRIDDPQLAKEMDIRPFEIFERQGIRIGVIGLSTEETTKTAIAERFVGMTFAPLEPSLDKAVAQTWEAGADVVVAIAHECPDILAPIVTKHPEWKLSFVGGGHCHKNMEVRAGDVPVMSPDWRMHQYVRVSLKVDKSLPVKSRVVTQTATFVNVVAGSPGMPDPALEMLVREWKGKVDNALGVDIGFSKSGIGPEPVVGQMVANAWLSEVGADVSIANKGGIRQVIPAGPVTRATIWGVLPFDNRLMKLSVLGADLLKELDSDKAIVAGADKRAQGQWFIKDKPIDLKKRYTVLITDYMYTGGDGSLFGKYDPHGVGTGVQWRDPVIAWIEKQKSTAAKPLENKLIVPKVPGTPGK